MFKARAQTQSGSALDYTTEKTEMKVTRQQLVYTARSFIGCKFSHQGRSRKHGIDCGGLILLAGRELGLTDLEELGYAAYPTNGRFDYLLATHAEDLQFESRYPHKFTGEELLPGDLLSFDYLNGEGTRHVAMVSKWDGSRYWIIDAHPDYGVTEKPLAHPFSRALLKAYRPRDLAG